MLSIEDLRQSKDFLKVLLDNITSAVFIIDRDMKIHSVNSFCKSLFGKAGEESPDELCGNFIECRHAREANVPCGSTPHCKDCMLRNCMEQCLLDRAATFREKLSREFYLGDQWTLKHFQFSMRHITYDREEMALLILEDITEMETQRQQLDEDLMAAAKIQHSLLPGALPKDNVIDVAWRFMPWHKVGGDIFNVFQLDANHWAIFMLDVSGHGLAASMIAVSVFHMLQPQSGHITRTRERSSYNAYLMKKSVSQYQEILSPSEVLELLNREYSMDRYDNFFTLSYLTLDTKKSVLKYSNAGHPFPVILHPDGSIDLLKKGGPVIGLGPENTPHYEEGQTAFRPGDKLFVYTDGLDEYENRSGKPFGRERFYEILKASPHKPVSQTLDEVIDTAMKFGDNAEPQDDISLLGLELRRGRQRGMP